MTYLHFPAGSKQILFLCGLTLIIGTQKTFYFFARKEKMRGSLCFLGGILLVFLKWPFIGFIVEIFGFLNLFGYVACCDIVFGTITELPYSDFFPVILTFLRQLPFIGTFLTLPYIRDVRGRFPLFSPTVQLADTPLFVNTGRRPFGWVETVRSMTPSQVA